MYDGINAAFNSVGAFFILLNALDINRRMDVAGHTYPSTVFFTVWSLYSVIFYIHLDQFWSFLVSVVMAIANVALLLLVFKHRKPPCSPSASTE